MVQLHEVLHIFLGSVSTLTIQSCYLDPSKYFIKAIGIQDQSPSHIHISFLTAINLALTSPNLPWNQVSSLLKKFSTLNLINIHAPANDKQLIEF